MSRMYDYLCSDIHISCWYITPDGGEEEDGYEGNMWFMKNLSDDAFHEAEDLFWTYKENGEEWYDAVYHAIKDIIIKSLPEGTKLTCLYVTEEESGYIIHDENDPI